MKFTFAIVALLATATAIKISDDAKPADPAAAKADAAAAAEAGKPAAAPVDPANPGKAIVAEALKTDE